MRVVIGKESGTASGVVNKINGLLGKSIQSPRDDYPGTVEVFDVVSVQVIRTAPESYYGLAVVDVGVREEQLDVEKAFFGSVEKTTPETL